MCVGRAARRPADVGGPAGPGNLVVLYGSRTGRDGIGGASVLASQGFGEDSAAKRPSVQIGDPFTGKKLIECTLELLERGLLGRSRISAPPGWRRRRPRWRPSGGVGIDIDLSASRCASRGWSRSRS